MKKLPVLLLVLGCTALTACNKGQEVSGHNFKTALKSVKALKNRLPTESRIEFEVAFWTIRDSIKNEDEFLDTVGGKTPLEVIALGKEVYQKRKETGFPGYDQYSSWEDMISKFGKERNDQENRKSTTSANKRKEDAKDKANDVLYKL
ncbi:MAG: hypothetical protein ACXW1W_14450 [Methylococcaceae bacterium]